VITPDGVTVAGPFSGGSLRELPEGSRPWSCPLLIDMDLADEAVQSFTGQRCDLHLTPAGRLAAHLLGDGGGGPWRFLRGTARQKLPIFTSWPLRAPLARRPIPFYLHQLTKAPVGEDDDCLGMLAHLALFIAGIAMLSAEPWCSRT
jgi:hypothetical protein